MRPALSSCYSCCFSASVAAKHKMPVMIGDGLQSQCCTGCIPSHGITLNVFEMTLSRVLMLHNKRATLYYCCFADTSLQRKVLLLLEHLSDAANLGMTCCLAQRACTALQQRRQQQQHPLPLCSPSNSSTDQQPQQELICVAAEPGVYQCTVTGVHNSTLSISSSSSSSDAAIQRLRDACTAVRDSSTFIRPSYSGGGTSGTSGLGHSSTAAADAAAGLAGSTLRLLKLLCLPVLDLSRLHVGSMISKGAFSEVLSGTVSAARTGPD